MLDYIKTFILFWWLWPYPPSASQDVTATTAQCSLFCIKSSCLINPGMTGWYGPPQSPSFCHMELHYAWKLFSRFNREQKKIFTLLHQLPPLVLLSSFHSFVFSSCLLFSTSVPCVSFSHSIFSSLNSLCLSSQGAPSLSRLVSF